MRRNILLSFVMIVLAATIASSQDTRYNFDRNADFSKFKTYKWVTLKNAAQLDNLLDQQIKAAVDAELARKGLTKVEDDSANLFVGYQAAVGQEKQFTTYGTDWGYG